MTLHDYGIQNEESDIRAHVSVVTRTVYVFETSAARAAIAAHPDCPIKFAGQPGCNGPTGKGYVMPLAWIDGVRRVRFRWVRWEEFQPTMSTSEKGALAVEFVVTLLKYGRFPLWIAATESDDGSVQIAGTDIVVAAHKRIQVKCDWKSGDPPLGTGNVFLQTAEVNPLKLH
jgi:hypothetical protein